MKTRRAVVVSHAACKRIRDIAERTGQPADALEPALRVLVEETGATAGAICLFDQTDRVLRLAAEAGLSHEGCRLLRTVRSGSGGWETPLRCVLDHHPYVIRNVPGNRHVPPLIDRVESVRAVACIPLHVNATPRGCVILVVRAPSVLRRSTLLGLAPALSELGQILAALPRRDDDRSTPVVATGLDPAGQAASLVQSLAGYVYDVARGWASAVAFPDPAVLAELERERDRLAAALEAATTECGTLRRARALLEQTRAADAQRLLEAEAQAARQRERKETLERLRARLEDEARDARTRVAQAEQELAAVVERDAAERLETLERALETTERTEAARATLAAEAEGLAGSLAKAQAAIIAAEDGARHARSEAGRATAATEAVRGERDQLRAELQAVRVRAEAATAGSAELERELETVRTEGWQLHGVIDEHEAQVEERWAAAVREAEAQAAREREQREALERLRVRLEDDARDARAQIAHAERELAATRAQAAADRRDTLKRALETMERAEASRATAAAEAESLAGSLAKAQAAIMAAEDEARHAQSKAERVEAAVESTREERDRLRTDLEEVQERAAAAESELDELRRELEAARAERQRLEAAAVERETARAETVAPAAVPGARAPAAPAPTLRAPEAKAPLVVAVLDLESAWAGVAGTDGRLVVVSPGPEAGARLAEIGAAAVLVNLATPGALDGMVAARQFGARARFLGYLSLPEVQRALPLGPIEPTGRPLDPDAVLALLADMSGKATRVFGAGADGDAFLSLRQALTRQGMSVSIAWDAKQAVDLIGLVRPEVVVVDLGMPRGDGYEIVGQIAALSPVPRAILVPAGDAAPHFATILKAHADAPHALPRERLVAGLLRPPAARSA